MNNNKGNQRIQVPGKLKSGSPSPKDRENSIPQGMGFEQDHAYILLRESAQSERKETEQSRLDLLH